MARVHGWESPRADFHYPGGVVNPSGLVRPLGDVQEPEHLVPVTVWVRPDRAPHVQPYQAVGWDGGRTRSPYSPYAIGGLVVSVAALAALAVCLVTALLALVAWVTAHALAVGVAFAALVVTTLLFLQALAPADRAGRSRGWRCECE